MGIPLPGVVGDAMLEVLRITVFCHGGRIDVRRYISQIDADIGQTGDKMLCVVELIGAAGAVKARNKQIEKEQKKQQQEEDLIHLKYKQVMLFQIGMSWYQLKKKMLPKPDKMFYNEKKGGL